MAKIFRRFMLCRTAASAAGIVSMTCAVLAAQASPTSQSSNRGTSLPGADTVKIFVAKRVAKNWQPPKTPWGDPDVQGVFTNKDENNTPFERPAEWTGRLMDDITANELAVAVAQRQVQAVEAAPFVGGGTAQDGVAITVPIHWFDNLTSNNSRPWFVIDPPDGTVPPLTAEARARPVTPFGRGPGRADSYADRSLWDRCIVRGVPVSVMMPVQYGNSFQILQTPETVVIRYEMIHEARVIPLDGRGHLSPTIRPHFGDARAHWDGNTLVIETTNLHEALVYRPGAGTAGQDPGPTLRTAVPAKNVRFIERFTRAASNKVEWSVTVDDPTTWTSPWSFSMPLTEDNTQPIHEYACHEGNFGIANILSAARVVEKR